MKTYESPKQAGKEEWLTSQRKPGTLGLAMDSMHRPKIEAKEKIMNYKEMHPVDRPSEKLKLKGAEALSDQDLLSIVCDLAAPVEEAALPPKKKAKLTAALELARRKAGNKSGRPVLDSASRVSEQITQAERTSKKEHFIAFYVNARNEMIHREVISVGTLSASLVHPREVFNPAILHSAAAIIITHNHPSGDCTPSTEDKDATRRLSRSGELLGIPLLDHLVVSENNVFSFKEHGLI